MTRDPHADRPSEPPPHGPRVRYLILSTLLAVAALIAGAVYSGDILPVLSRTLHGAAAAAPAQSQPAAAYYTCGMHPWVILPRPGDCPICHMKLVPLDASKFTTDFAIDPVMSQAIGVRLAEVTSGPLTQDIRTVGNVDYDETAVRDVTTKVAGWIEKLYVNSTGQPVKKGQPLFELYAPELVTAQYDYLMALKDTAQPILLETVTTRLKFFDVTDAQIAALAKSGRVTKTLTISSPFDGMVVTKGAVEGIRIEAGTDLYRIADLSKVWVLATLYEYQLPYVQVGQKAVMSLPYIPGQTFEGKVAYIYPYLNPETRQVKLRLEFANPTLLLKPGMFANIELQSTLARDRTLAPREAVIDTGTRQVAFVSLGQGRFDPRVVRLGVEAENGQVEILSGLAAGEKVVVSAQFLLDSESRLREALAKMVKGEPAASEQTIAALAQAPPNRPIPAAAAKELTAMVDDYLAIGALLSSDKADGLAAPARALAQHTDALLNVPMPDEHFWHKHMEAATVRGKALELIETTDLAGARERFADLSFALSTLLKATAVPAEVGKEIQELHCPMYREGQGGSIWLQDAGEVKNPFFGKSMLHCFDKRFSLPTTRPVARASRP